VINPAAQKKLRASGCDVRFDNLTRQLYATDASIYQIEPSGVAFPSTAWEARVVIKNAADENISITPRGAGTGLSGGAIRILNTRFARYPLTFRRPLRTLGDVTLRH